MRLPAKYYENEDVAGIARDLIGKSLCTKINGVLTCGIITETEAYAGVIDKASHAYGGRRTERTETMFGGGGVSYVYLCYGLHHLFNIVTNKRGTPEAVLIRAIYPTVGIPAILERRNATSLKKNLCVGPGKVSEALGITRKQNNLSLTGKTIWLEDKGIKIDKKKIQVGPRIGVDYAGEDAKLPYRFWIDQSELEIEKGAAQGNGGHRETWSLEVKSTSSKKTGKDAPQRNSGRREAQSLKSKSNRTRKTGKSHKLRTEK